MLDPRTYQPKPPAALPLRPTLVIGLGGTGHRIGVEVKALARKSWGEERINQMLKFLVFDTARETLTVQGISLEPETEFIDIGQTPVANIKRNLDRQAAIKERFGGVMASLPPVVLRSGAKQLRPLGLLSLYWCSPEIEARLQAAIWELANRRQAEGQEGINVFIANSLVGGTGSSTFLDVAYLVRALFDSLGSMADFCYLTGVGVLPRAFHGIQGPNLIPNAVASLIELNHGMQHGDFRAHYPNGRTIQTEQPPFNLYYLVDGVDERGRTWSGLNDVCRLAAEAIFLQIGSQVGQKHKNDFDNLDEVLAQQTAEGEGTFHGSFGLAALVFAGPTVAQACAARQAMRVIDQGLLSPTEPALANLPPASRDSGGETQVETFLAGVDLEPERLMDRLACDDQGLPLTVELAVPGFADRLSPQQRPAQLVPYVRGYERVRLGIDYQHQLNQNETHLGRAATDALNSHLARLAARSGLPTAENFLQHLIARLDQTIGRWSVGQPEQEHKLTALTQALAQQETRFLQTAEGLFLGRNRRIIQAQQAYFEVAGRLFQLRWQTHRAAGMLAILNQLGRAARERLAGCQETMTRLRAVRRMLAKRAAVFEAETGVAGVTTHSLANEALVSTLFERYALPVADMLATLFSQGASPLDWHDRPPEAIQQSLLAACQAPFAPVAAMSVEEALALGDQPPSAEAVYTWLMTQAAPSWNLDRARLPDGGAGLRRLEVLGVPDETTSRFRRRAAILVSTGDPSRLVAFVAHIGAPHSALQNWADYQAEYERARSHTPLHILPHFQTDNDYARQTFALGTIFHVIVGQGTYFYYYPADPLAQPVKLAQGLANALQAFTNQDGLVREVRERVEGAVARQGVAATLRGLEAYYYRPDPRDQADELVLDLKRLVRAYAEELRQIYRFTAGPGGTEEAGPSEDGKEGRDAD